MASFEWIGRGDRHGLLPYQTASPISQWNHLLYAVDLPNDDAATMLLENVLKALAGRFNDGRVKVDQSVFNAGRVVKAYGTVARKGDDVPERPHRLSRILDMPHTMEAVSCELLAELVQRATRPPSANNPPPRGGSHFDIQAFLSRNL